MRIALTIALMLSGCATPHERRVAAVAEVLRAKAGPDPVPIPRALRQ